MLCRCMALYIFSYHDTSVAFQHIACLNLMRVQDSETKAMGMMLLPKHLLFVMSTNLDQMARSSAVGKHHMTMLNFWALASLSLLLSFCIYLCIYTMHIKLMISCALWIPLLLQSLSITNLLCISESMVEHFHPVHNKCKSQVINEDAICSCLRSL